MSLLTIWLVCGFINLVVSENYAFDGAEQVIICFFGGPIMTVVLLFRWLFD